MRQPRFPRLLRGYALSKFASGSHIGHIPQVEAMRYFSWVSPVMPGIESLLILMLWSSCLVTSGIFHYILPTAQPKNSLECKLDGRR